MKWTFCTSDICKVFWDYFKSMDVQNSEISKYVVAIKDFCSLLLPYTLYVITQHRFWNVKLYIMAVGLLRCNPFKNTLEKKLDSENLPLLEIAVTHVNLTHNKEAHWNKIHDHTATIDEISSSLLHFSVNLS